MKVFGLLVDHNSPYQLMSLPSYTASELQNYFFLYGVLLFFPWTVFYHNFSGSYMNHTVDPFEDEVNHADTH